MRLPAAHLAPAPTEDHGGLLLYRLWHPTARTPTADHFRTWGPAWRFDPHPARPGGGAVDRPDGPGAWYGGEAFATAVRERFDRFEPHAPDRLVSVCARSRMSAVRLPSPTRLLDLTVHAAAIGADDDLGDQPDIDYEVTWAWARALHAVDDYDGLRYHSARHRGPDGSREGVNVVLWRLPAGRLEIVSDEPLALAGAWSRVLTQLDHAGVGAVQVNTCADCLR